MMSHGAKALMVENVKVVLTFKGEDEDHAVTIIELNEPRVMYLHASPSEIRQGFHSWYTAAVGKNANCRYRGYSTPR